MRSITDANRMSVRSRYSSEPKGPFLNVKKRDLMSHRIQLVACFTQWTRIATTKGGLSFVPTAVGCASATKIVRPQKSTVETQPQLQPALLRVSATISQYFTRFDSASFGFHTVMTKCVIPVAGSPSESESRSKTFHNHVARIGS
jgi:hypothetical protein